MPSSVGRPLFDACMRRDGDRGICRASARPYVRWCMRGKVASIGIGAITFTSEARARQFQFWCRRNIGGSNKFFAREKPGGFELSQR